MKGVESKAGPNGEWRIYVEDDDRQGFNWTAHRMGVLCSKGWFRTRNAKLAALWAKQTALGLHGAEQIQGAA